MAADVRHYPLHGRSFRFGGALGAGRFGVGLVVMRRWFPGWRYETLFSPQTRKSRNPPLLEVRLHDVALGHRGQAAFEGLSGCFSHGSLTAVVGANGAGKTSLLQGLMGLLLPLHGRLECPIPVRNMAYLPQVHNINREAPVSVVDFISLGLWNHTGSLRGVRAPDRLRIAEAVTALGLCGLEKAWISDLSGGQFQRVRFARLLVQDAAIVLLDEPFAGIDAQTVQVLMPLIARWHMQGKLVVAVLHDMELVRQHFPRTLVLAGAASAWGATADVLACGWLAKTSGAAVSLA